MLFTLVLGTMVGGAAVLLLEQWVRDVLGDGRRPVRLITPSGASIVRYRGRRAA
jgi:uncharacterized membrane-anchored protein